MQGNRVWVLAALAALVSNQSALAATFAGQGTATFRVSEILNGSETSVSKQAPASFVLTTDYTQIAWSISWDVNLVMAGGPSQPFETDFQSTGMVATTAPSLLSFPDATGTANAGTYSLTGNTQWVVSERIVTATETHESGPKTVGPVGSSHSLSVFNYPTNVKLQTNLTNVATFLGRTPTTGNNYIEAYMYFFGTSLITMTEQLPGDFNSSSIVDGGDYVTWRKGGGLSPLLSSYPVWRSNYGNQTALGADFDATSVPEPASALLLAIVTVAIGGLRNRSV